jgi:hypothetical protein
MNARAAAHRLPDADTFPAELRAQMTAASRRLLKGAPVMFRHGGALRWGVSRAAVRAYLIARLVGADLHQALAVALLGTAELGEEGLAHIRATVWRLSQLEAGHG